MPKNRTTSIQKRQLVKQRASFKQNLSFLSNKNTTKTKISGKNVAKKRHRGVSDMKVRTKKCVGEMTNYIDRKNINF